MQITFNIPDDKVQKVIDAMKGLYPIPQVLIDPNNPMGGTEPQFTDTQWAKEKTRRWIRDQVARWEQKIAQDAIEFSPEDNIIS